MADPLPRGRGGFYDPADQAEAAAGQSAGLQRLTEAPNAAKTSQILRGVVAVLFCLLTRRDGTADLSQDLEDIQPVSDYFWKFFSSFYYL